MPQFRLTQPAIRDIEAIADYIARESGLTQADRFLTRLNTKFIKITQFPNLGRSRDEILPKLRSLPIDQYLILYLCDDLNRINILRIISGYRDLKALFSDTDD